MTGWLFVLAITLLMAAVVYFAWQSDTAAIAEDRERAAAADSGVLPEEDGVEPTR